MTDHRDTWSAPSGGWPTFDENGRRVKESDEWTLSDEDQDKIANLLGWNTDDE